MELRVCPSWMSDGSVCVGFSAHRPECASAGLAIGHSLDDEADYEVLVDNGDGADDDEEEE